MELSGANRAALFLVPALTRCPCKIYNNQVREKQSLNTKNPENDDRVKLKPIMGIRPGVYLTALYSVILLLIIFFILIFPGLRNPQAAIILKTEPEGAALRVDGVYMGTSPEKVLVTKGVHNLELILPGFHTVSMEREIPARVFGSALFPREYPLEVKLDIIDPAHAFAYYAADFAAWSFGGEPTSTWQVPLSLSTGAYRVGSAGLGAHSESLQEILNAAARFTVTKAALRDIVRAKNLLDNGGQVPSVASLFNTIAGIAVFLSENPGSAEWLANLLPVQSSTVITASTWYQNEFAGIGERKIYITPESTQNAILPIQRLEVESIAIFFCAANFTTVSSGFFPLTKTMQIISIISAVLTT